MSTGRPKPLDEAGLRAAIQRALERGYFRESFHAAFEHPERSITTDDVIHGLERDGWSLARTPDWDAKHRNWEYLIRTQDVEGDELHIKIAFFEGGLQVITRW